MDSLFMIYDDQFVIPGNNEETREAISNIRDYQKQRREIMKRLKQVSNSQEKQKLKWEAERLRILIRQAKGTIYLYEHKG